MPFTVQGLTSGTITGVQDEGALMPPENILNFTGGGITLVDDPANGRTNVIVPVGAGGGWADDGAVVRLVTVADQVVVGALIPTATEKLRVVGQLRIDQGSLAAPLLFGSDSLFVLSSNTVAVATSATFQNTSPNSTSGVIVVAGTVAAQQSGMAIIAVGSTNAATDAGDGLLQHYSGVGTTSLRIQSVDTATLAVTVIHARAYRSGAWAFGEVANSDTSAEAQAGITGLILNIAAATGGVITSVANQGVLWNSAGQLNTQGHVGLGFWMATTQYGQLDSASIWRFGPDFASTPIYAPLGGLLANFSGTNVSDNIVAIQGRAAAASGLLSVTGGSAAGSYGGVILGGFGTGYATAALAGNGSIQQIGGATSRLIFSKISGALAGAANTGSIWQSGAWVIGEAANNDTSTEAQAGITGPIVNISAVGAIVLTSVANQMVLYNNAGIATMQGHAGHDFYVSTNLAGRWTSTRRFLIGTAPTTSYAFDSNSLAACISTTAGEFGSFDLVETAADSVAMSRVFAEAGAVGTLIGLQLIGAGSASSVAQWQGNGVIDQIGADSSALVFSSLDHTAVTRTYRGRIWQSGAWSIGDSANNDTSAEAQAGLTGPLVNLSPTTGGGITTVANQALLYNVAGAAHLQGNVSADLEVGAGLVMVEARDLGTNREVVALCRGSIVTTTQMPASTGDRVIYIANATTDPAADPVSGHIEYGSGGAGVGRGSGSTVTTYVAA